MDKNSKNTLNFYNTQSTQYVAETVDLDVSNIRNLFLNPEGSPFLDLVSV